MHIPVTIVVSFVFTLIAIFFPYKAPTNYASANISVLAKQYAKWELFAIVPLFSFMALITYSLGRLLFWLQQVQDSKADLSIFKILPNEYQWYGTAFILSFVILLIPMHITYKLLLGERYEEYIIYTNIKHGYDGWMLMKPISIFLGVISCIIIFLTTDHSIKIYRDRIEFNDFLTLKTQLKKINDIKSTYYVEKIKYTNDEALIPHHFITFKDGSFWDTNEGLGNPKVEKPMIEFLLKKTNLKADTLEYNPK